jgi:hypothetical protein
MAVERLLPEQPDRRDSRCQLAFSYKPIDSKKPNLFAEQLFGFGKALMTFMGDVGSTLTQGMWEDEAVRATKEIMIIRNTQFVADIVERVEVLDQRSTQSDPYYKLNHTVHVRIVHCACN